MKICLALLLLFILLSCSQSIRVTKAETIPEPKSTELFSNEELDSSIFNKTEAILFTQSIQKMANHDYTGAEADLIDLLGMKTKEKVRNYANQTLYRLYMILSRWEDYYRISRDQISGTFSKLPYEEYIFPENSVVIPLIIGQQNKLAIDIDINSRKKRFLIDTGATLTVVSSSILNDCNLKRLIEDNSLKNGTITEKKVNISPTCIDIMKIGKLEIHNIPAEIIQANNFMDNGFIYDGIIGWDLIQHLTLELDCKNKLLTLSKPEEKENSKNNLYNLGWFPVVQMVDHKGTVFYFELDTGAYATLLMSHYFTKIPDKNISKEVLYITGLGGYDNYMARYVIDVNLIIGEFNVYFTKLVEHPQFKQFIPLDGILGMDIIQNKDHKIIIDNLNGRFDIMDAE